MIVNGCPRNQTYLKFFAAFGLGTMIYIGLEFGTFFEIPFTSPCHQILRGVNPLLQMIFTFMQMYFVFMNSRVRSLLLLGRVFHKNLKSSLFLFS